MYNILNTLLKCLLLKINLFFVSFMSPTTFFFGSFYLGKSPLSPKRYNMVINKVNTIHNKLKRSLAMYWLMHGLVRHHHFLSICCDGFIDSCPCNGEDSPGVGLPPTELTLIPDIVIMSWPFQTHFQVVLIMEEFRDIGISKVQSFLALFLLLIQTKFKQLIHLPYTTLLWFIRLPPHQKRYQIVYY